ncbi:MAG TPA: hypothetical protein DIT25_03330 [Candidatus Moranbacteria bacterium]|nr:hypothetical protein [Candidatus Moranbacteria bacterium]
MTDMQKKIIILIVALFAVSSSYFFHVSEKGMSMDHEKNWWAVYFNNPKDNSLNFTIENHSGKNDFAWEVLDGNGNMLIEGDLNIAKGESRELSSQAWELSSLPSGKISIQVSNGQGKREIYKNFRN